MRRRGRAPSSGRPVEDTVQAVVRGRRRKTAVHARLLEPVVGVHFTGPRCMPRLAVRAARTRRRTGRSMWRRWTSAEESAYSWLPGTGLNLIPRNATPPVGLEPLASKVIAVQIMFV